MYRPLDLHDYYNTGARILRNRGEVPLGAQTFHGIPFRIGSNPRRCFLGFGGRPGARRAVTIAVRQKARWVVFSHTLLETKIPDGETIGRTIAHYLIRWEEGGELRVPIRERFEIHVVPTGWGQLPFRAVPDLKNFLYPRHEGRWDMAGWRQTEAGQAFPSAYYLWAWRNPRPGQRIESITIEPGDRKFLLAAITLGLAEEEPFPRQARREVKITLPRKADATRPFALEVDVDRGVATYPYPLPTQSAARFLADDFKGWGQASNPKSTPAYVRVAASPSATLTIRSAGKVLGRANWGKLQRAGAVRTPRVHLELLDRGRNWVHVTVLDDETGKPIPCRVHFRSPEGIPYQPHGHHDHVLSDQGSWHRDIGGDLRLGAISYAYIDGTCQGWLPRGEVIADIARGFEYQPLRTTVRVERGTRELTFRLRRWINLNARRWFSGDTHVHFLGTQGAHREAQGEDLNLVHLLQSQWGHLFTNTEDFIGRPTISPDGRTIVYCSQENRQHLLGHLTLLGLKRPVMPWCSDGPAEAELGGPLETTLSRWADACHEQSGTVIIPHLPNPNGEPAVLIATGRADAVEMLYQGSYQQIEYYRYLNCGYRLPLVGGTDKMSSDVPVGLYRTYAYIPEEEEFTYDNWCKAVRLGRTFLSGGPILQFRVDGALPGDTIRLSSPGTIEVEAVTDSILPVQTLEIVQQGRVVASTVERRGSRHLQLKTKLHINGHSWLAARCGGPAGDGVLTTESAIAHHDWWRRGVYAHTSPVYVAVGGDWWMFDRDTAQYMLTLIEGGLAYIRERSPQHPAGQVTHHHGQEDHLAYLEAPFHEAAAAIHRRMHQLGIPH